MYELEAQQLEGLADDLELRRAAALLRRFGCLPPILINGSFSSETMIGSSTPSMKS